MPNHIRYEVEVTIFGTTTKMYVAVPIEAPDDYHDQIIQNEVMEIVNQSMSMIYQQKLI